MTSPDDGPSPTAFPPDDVLRENLVRLPPQPSSLLRASSVSKHWRALVGDPVFLHDYRARHSGRPPPILGVFHNNPLAGGRFIGAADLPDRVPAERFSPLHLGCDRWLVLSSGRWLVHGCRRGRAILHDGSGQLLVWDPLSDCRCYVKIPPLEGHGYRCLNAVLIRNGDDDGGGWRSPRRFPHCRFAVASVAAGTAVARVYSSDTGVWSNHAVAEARTSIPTEKPGAAVGSAVYWQLNDGRILSLRLFANGLQALFVLATKVPSVYTGNVQLTSTPDDKLGLATVTGSALHLLALETDGDGHMSWTLRKTFQLDAAVVPAGPVPVEVVAGEQRPAARIMGINDDGDVVFLWTVHGIVMVRLELESESTQMKMMYGANETKGQFYCVYPYASSFSQR